MKNVTELMVLVFLLKNFNGKMNKGKAVRYSMQTTFKYFAQHSGASLDV